MLTQTLAFICSSFFEQHPTHAWGPCISYINFLPTHNSSWCAFILPTLVFEAHDGSPIWENQSQPSSWVPQSWRWQPERQSKPKFICPRPGPSVLVRARTRCGGSSNPWWIATNSKKGRLVDCSDHVPMLRNDSGQSPFDRHFLTFFR